MASDSARGARCTLLSRREQLQLSPIYSLSAANRIRIRNSVRRVQLETERGREKELCTRPLILKVRTTRMRYKFELSPTRAPAKVDRAEAEAGVCSTLIFICACGVAERMGDRILRRGT